MKESQTMNRRQFLLGAAGVTVAAGGGLAYFAARQPHIDFATASCGSGRKVLVTYASQYGSTSEVAAAIGEVFCELGMAAEVLPIAEVKELDSYQSVVIGGPVISEEWRTEAAEFVEVNQVILQKKPVAYFLTCMMLGLAGDSPAVRQEVASFLDPVSALVAPVDKGLFAGALDYSKMSYAMQLLYRAFAEDTTDGDYRDWAAIRAWAANLQPALMSG